MKHSLGAPTQEPRMSNGFVSPAPADLTPQPAQPWDELDCHDCGGEGRFYRGDYAHGDLYEPCGTCEGRGKVGTVACEGGCGTVEVKDCCPLCLAACGWAVCAQCGRDGSYHTSHCAWYRALPHDEVTPTPAEDLALRAWQEGMAR